MPDRFTDFALPPTGSGVADLEIAFEQVKVAESRDLVLGRDGDDMVGSPASAGAGDAKSEGHPS